MGEAQKMKLYKEKYTVAAISAFIFGFISHGYIIVNKISFHDDIGQMFSVGATYELGRFVLGVVKEIMNASIGLYSSSFENGLLTIGCIAVATGLLVKLLGISNYISAILIAGIMSVFPVITCWFAFMFTSSMYAISVLAAVAACYVACTMKNCVWGGVFGSILIAISLGIYQAHLTVCASIFLMILMKDILNEKSEFSCLIRKGISFLITGVSGVFLYMICVKLFCFLKNVELSGYQGIGQMGRINLVQGIVQAYTAFISLIMKDVAGLTNSLIIRIVLIFCICISAGMAFVGCRSKIKNNSAKILFLLCIILFPLAVNLVYIMTSNGGMTSVHTLMLYGEVFLFVLPVFLFDLLQSSIKNKKSSVFLSRGLTGILLVSLFYYIHLDNEAYLKITLLQEQTNSYFTTLVTQIKSTENYTDDLPVIFIGGGNIKDKTLTEMKQFSNVSLAAYEWDMDDWINNYQFVNYIRYYCGYQPEILEPDGCLNNEEINRMPSYPDMGAIRVLNNIIVVKLGNKE